MVGEICETRRIFGYYLAFISTMLTARETWKRFVNICLVVCNIHRMTGKWNKWPWRDPKRRVWKFIHAAGTDGL
jgi:hypothetical protein